MDGYASIVASTLSTCPLTSEGLEEIIKEMKENIEEVKTEVDLIPGKIEEVKTEITDTKAKIELNSGKIEEVKIEVDDIEAKIDLIPGKINEVREEVQEVKGIIEEIIQTEGNLIILQGL